MKIFDANISGSLTVSGSAHFQSDITVDGVINATISGTTSNAISSSYAGYASSAGNANLLDNMDSTQFATTGSNTFKAGQIVSGSISIVDGGTLYINGQSYSTQTSGTSGTSGSSGSSGSNGSSGTSGSSGSNGSSGTSGSSGSNGSSGTSGSSGSTGTSGSSGSNGSSGTSGSSGSNGSSGTSGTSGSSGSNGSSGTAGTSGTSVTVSGTDGVLGKFSSNSMVNSNVSDNGSLVKINSNTTITGSLILTQNLTVLGSSSITYVTSSQLRVDDNIITVNTAGVAQRFGGLEIYDSGSSFTTASLLWDSVNNKFLYQHPAGADTYASAWLMSGPVNTGTLGSEVGLTTNRVAKSTDDDHIGDSNIVDDGTTIRNLSNTEVTGSLKVTTNVTAAGFTGSGFGLSNIPNSGLTNSSLTVSAGTGMSGGGAVSLGGSVTLTNAGVTSNVAGTGVSVSSGTGAVTISIGQAVATSSQVQFNSLGVNTAAPATAGLIRATNDVIAYYGSDERLKENIAPIENSLDILKQINGYYFDWKEMTGIHENEGHDIGVIAQEIDAVLPEIVTTRENGYMAVKYEKLVALLIQTNKELLNRVEALEAKIK